MVEWSGYTTLHYTTLHYTQKGVGGKSLPPSLLPPWNGSVDDWRVTLARVTPTTTSGTYNVTIPCERWISPWGCDDDDDDDDDHGA